VTDYSRQSTISVWWPNITQTFTFRHGIGYDPIITLKEVYDLVDEIVDLALVAARGETILVINASEL
jgi:hypothetical protein